MQLPLKCSQPACAAATLVLLVASRAAAGPCPPIAFGPPHDSLDEAAVTTLHTAFRDNHRYEPAGSPASQRSQFIERLTDVTQRAWELVRKRLLDG